MQILPYIVPVCRVSVKAQFGKMHETGYINLGAFSKNR